MTSYWYLGPSLEQNGTAISTYTPQVHLLNGSETAKSVLVSESGSLVFDFNFTVTEVCDDNNVTRGKGLYADTNGIIDINLHEDKWIPLKNNGNESSLLYVAFLHEQSSVKFAYELRHPNTSYTECRWDDTFSNQTCGSCWPEPWHSPQLSCALNSTIMRVSLSLSTYIRTYAAKTLQSRDMQCKYHVGISGS